MQNRYFKPRLSTWLPFGLRRLDLYFSKAYIKILILILAAMAMLIAIGDIFQRFDDFVVYARNNELDLAETSSLFIRYYVAFIPHLIFQYMFPLSILLAGAITATSAYMGPRGNNEYTVIRSVGIPVRRALMPLIFPALFVVILFQASRDYFLPHLVRERSAIYNQLRDRSTDPVNISMIHGDEFQTVAIGWFSPEGIAHNMILEVRNLDRYQRADSAQGDNDFVAFHAVQARLEPVPGGEGYQWRPLTGAEAQLFTRFSRRSAEWIQPIATSLTPSMIERQTQGDAVCTWRELMSMQADNSSARIELHWRLSEPIACGILLLWGLGILVGRMLRGKGSGYIQAVAISILATGLFNAVRLFGMSLWENGVLTPFEAVWLPLALTALVSIPIVYWMER